MAIVDNDVASVFMNPSAYSQVKGDGKKAKGRTVRRSGEGAFSRIFDEFRSKTGDELGLLHELPTSEETTTKLMDEVHSAGSALRDRPCSDEIIRYKQAVRNFMHYIVKNSLSVEHETGLPRFMKPGFTGNRGTVESEDKKVYTKIQVIDKKLEDLAAGVLAGQLDQLKMIAGLEEITGLLIDLLQ